MLADNKEDIRNSIIESIAKTNAKFTYMHPIDNIDLKLYYTQFIKYEVGSEEGICALLMDTFIKECDEKTRKFINDLDLGYISGESLLEHYRGSPHAEAIDRMAGQLADSPFDEATIEPLLNDTLKKLEADAVSREIDALNAQERERGLNATERRHLAELFVRKQKLQARTKAQDS